jgi:hypothetical protein
MPDNPEQFLAALMFTEDSGQLLASRIVLTQHSIPFLLSLATASGERSRNRLCLCHLTHGLIQRVCLACRRLFAVLARNHQHVL